MGLIRTAGRCAAAALFIAIGYCAAVYLQWELHYAHNSQTVHNQVLPTMDGALVCPVDQHVESWTFNAYPAQRPQSFDVFQVREGVNQ